MPRDNMPFNKTWPYLLQQSLPECEVISRVQRALHTNMLFGGAAKDYLEFYQADTVIMQIGIVDCAPRYLKNGSTSLKIVNSMPAFVSRQIWHLIKKYGSRKSAYADVDINSFEANLFKYADRTLQVNVSNFICVKIAGPGTAMVNKNKEIPAQVKIYNAVFEKLALTYPHVSLAAVLENAGDEYFLEDGYHLSEPGNLALSKCLTELISKQNS